jgi:hypothetical protein
LPGGIVGQAVLRGGVAVGLLLPRGDLALGVVAVVELGENRAGAVEVVDFLEALVPASAIAEKMPVPFFSLFGWQERTLDVGGPCVEMSGGMEASRSHTATALEEA